MEHFNLPAIYFKYSGSIPCIIRNNSNFIKKDFKKFQAKLFIIKSLKQLKYKFLFKLKIDREFLRTTA